MDRSLLCSLIREDPTRRAIFGVEVYFQPDPMCFFFYELITTSPVRVSLRSYLNLGKFTDAAGRQIFFVCLLLVFQDVVTALPRQMMNGGIPKRDDLKPLLI
jgi:hypothetical protein